METDYSQYLHVTEDGEIWWPLDVAIKLAAGYLPRSGDDQLPDPTLMAPGPGARANERNIVAAVHDRRNGETVPLIIRRGSGHADEDSAHEHFVTARAFLTWVNQHLCTTNPGIRLPDDLISAVKRTHAMQCPAEIPKAFESLAAALSGWFDKPLSDIPPEKLKVLKETDEHLYLLWDHLEKSKIDSHTTNAAYFEQLKHYAETQRRNRAEQWDYQHDPATEAQREKHFELFAELLEAKRERTRIEKMAATTPTETEARNRLFGKFDTDIERLERQIAQLEGRDPTLDACLHNLGDSERDDDEIGIEDGGDDFSSAFCTNKSKTRHDALSCEIESVIGDLGEDATVDQVVAGLARLAGRKGSAVIDVSREAVIWLRHGTNEAEKTSIRALKERLRKRNGQKRN